MKPIPPLFLLAVLGGCEDRNATDEWFPHCDETRTELSDDEVSELGFSADDVLAALAAPVQSDAEWFDDTPATVTLDALRTADAVAFVQSTPAEPPEDYQGDIPSIAVICEDSLAIPVTLTLGNDAGDFDETFTAELRATAVDTFAWSDELAPDELSGSYAPEDDVVEDYDDWGYHFRVESSEAGTSGEIGLWGEGTDGDVAYAENVPLITWPTPE